jgi:hypothetical protein
MDSSMLPVLAPVAKRVAPIVAAAVVAVGGIGYAVHEHNTAQALAVENAQVTAQLSSSLSQLGALTAKVNALASASESRPADAIPGEAKPSPSTPAHRRVTRQRAAAAHRGSAQDARFKKLQSQIDAQGKAIDDTRSDLASTRTELSGSIARTHGELVLLQKKGERNYYEFDLMKSKDFKREGPVSVSLRKANEKHQYADLMLIVEDRNLQQKHVNLYQPVMFYRPDSPQPVEIVINQVSKNHIHGYISAPKYKQSELASMADENANPAQAVDQASSSSQPPARRKLSLSDNDIAQQ